MQRNVLILLVALLTSLEADARTYVFWQQGFPTVASQPVPRTALDQALKPLSLSYVDETQLSAPNTLADADLLVLPYGSAAPVDAWPAIERYLKSGGNLLIMGGQPLRVPVSQKDGEFVEGDSQDTYARALGFRHSYEVFLGQGALFQWRSGYSWLPSIAIRARRYFSVEGRLEGLGYMRDTDGNLAAAPVIFADSEGEQSNGAKTEGRIVALDFDPEAGYWESADGVSLINAAADYARHGALHFSIETLFSAIRPGELPVITAHVSSARLQAIKEAVPADVQVDILADNKMVASAKVSFQNNGVVNLQVPFQQHLPAGFYEINAMYEENNKRFASYTNGFLVSDGSELNAGPALGVRGNFLSLDDRPFLPVGTNYFTTEENGWDFSGPRNVWIWDKDFSEMETHGVTFVRTGVWMPNAKFIQDNTGGADERFLRNLEAFLLCAKRHHIAINFTFFAFSPHSGPLARSADASPANPYTDPSSVAAQQAYIRSVVERFKRVPWLCWDLVNEPSFSNPRQIFRGNYPNGDLTETAAWHKWLRTKYRSLSTLGDAWRVPVSDLGNFDSIPLPSISDLRYERYGNPNQIRALDYNLFAQDTFSDWLKSMITLIRSTGSLQLIDIGQDEGGVTDRVLNQFYGGSGVSFTTNHTYWQDDALLWDSVAAKRPGVPNITGETGYQPVWASDGSWRYDEYTGLGLTERKWALGFAAGSSGALQWDWAREVDFGMKRSDGSAKAWENMMSDLGRFARDAGPFATSLRQPEVAIVLPQSFQLSVGNAMALEAQQASVRALYNYARSQAYAVGEYQIDLLGSPKLIILPSPFGLTEEAWKAIEEHVRAGATVLVTGPFAEDAHFHSTDRGKAIGLDYTLEPLTVRNELFRFPGGTEELVFGGMSTTVLNRASLPNHEDWSEYPLGKGKILFSALPLELNSNLAAIGDVYRYALKSAGVEAVYSTSVNDPGILICPTLFPNATLYVLASESNQTEINFKDLRSGTTISGTLPTGRAALLLLGTNGKTLATYHWSYRSQPPFETEAIRNSSISPHTH